MHIDHYAYGTITIDDTTYTADLKLFPDQIHTDWWRPEGHLLQPDDLDDVIQHGPDTLIVGQGTNKRMKIAAETRDLLDDHAIQLDAADTHTAVKRFNQANQDVVGAFHLTC